jgi:phosphoglycolate phosphatase-like HAD superfamily hydrolase
MRCSECSREIKPVVAIDIDGTLGDFHSYFLAFSQAYIGQRFVFDYDGSESFRDWWCEATGCSEEDWRDVKLAYRQGGMKRSMPIYDDAAKLCHTVQWAGAELWLTTTRPYLRLDNIDPDTRAWLSRYGIRYDGLLYDEWKYARLAKLIDHDRVVAVLDDLPEMMRHAADHFGTTAPIWRRTQWNVGGQLVNTIARTNDLSSATAMILNRLQTWKERHAEQHAESV